MMKKWSREPWSPRKPVNLHPQPQSLLWELWEHHVQTRAAGVLCAFVFRVAAELPRLLLPWLHRWSKTRPILSIETFKEHTYT